MDAIEFVKERNRMCSTYMPKRCEGCPADSLKDAITRRDKQIEDMKQGMAQLAKAVAVKEEEK